MAQPAARSHLTSEDPLTRTLLRAGVLPVAVSERGASKRQGELYLWAFGARRLSARLSRPAQPLG